MPVFLFSFFDPKATKYVTLKSTAAPLWAEGNPLRKPAEIKANNPGQDPTAEAAESAQAAREGRMSKKEAEQILDSMKKYEKRVSLPDTRKEPAKQPK